MKSLDLSKFKKMSSDKTCTTLKHEAGHELRIAHKGLSHKMREELEKLPVHKAEGGMANSSNQVGALKENYGGNKKIKRFADGDPDGEDSIPPYLRASNNTDDQAAQPASPVNININTSPTNANGSPVMSDADKQALSNYIGGGNKPNAQLPANDPTAMSRAQQQEQQAALMEALKNNGQAPAAASAAPQANASLLTPEPAQPEQAPTTENTQVPPSSREDRNTEQEINDNEDYGRNVATDRREEVQGYKLPPQNYDDLKDSLRQQYMEEDQAFQHDLNNGHITPETYGSLFAKKDTLGKIGTIFGMILSGAGSGLSHQPNALMAKMDKQISNDLDAQKQSKLNAQNFLRTNQAHMLQGAQIQQMLASGQLTAAQAKAALKDLEIKTDAFSRSQMNRVALHKLASTVQNLPVGSQQRIQAEQTLAMLAQTVNNENYGIADRAAAQSAILNYAGGAGGGNEEKKFQTDNRMLRMGGNEPLAKDREEKHFPGLAGQASVPLNSADREELSGGVSFQTQLDDFIDWTKKHSGSLNPKEIAEGRAKAADLQGAYRKATHGGVYKEGEQNFISKLIDEEPTKFFNSVRVLPSLKALSEDNQRRVDAKAKTLGFSGYSSPRAAAAPPENSGATYEMLDPKSGRIVIVDKKSNKPLRWKK